MKVKIDKKEFEINDINLSDRCDLNDLVIRKVDKPSFSMWVKVINICTDLTDDQINALSSSNIIELATKCIDLVNKKKD